MKRKFQVLIEGTVESNPDMQGDTFAEMEKAVADSFRPDLQWGVKLESLDVIVIRNRLVAG